MQEPAPQGKPRSLLEWSVIALLPAIFHIVFLSGVFVVDEPLGGETVIVFLVGMPAFALLYLLTIVLVVPVLRLQDGRTLSKPLFFFGFFALNVLLWIGGCAAAASA